MGRFEGYLQSAPRAVEVSRGDRLEGEKVADGDLPPMRPCRSDFAGVNERKKISLVDGMSNECEGDEEEMRDYCNMEQIP